MSERRRAGIGRCRETTEETCLGRNSEGHTGHARRGRSREITKQTYHDIQVETRKIGQEQVGIAGARRPQAGIGNRREDTVETHPCGQE